MTIKNTFCELKKLSLKQIDTLVSLMPKSEYFDFISSECLIGFDVEGDAGTWPLNTTEQLQKVVPYNVMINLLELFLGVKEEPEITYHIHKKEKGTTEAIVDMIRSRSAVGLDKYGVSMDRTDLSTEQWIQHAIEEMLDGAQYLYRIKQELAKRLDK